LVAVVLCLGPYWGAYNAHSDPLVAREDNRKVGGGDREGSNRAKMEK